MRSTTHLAVAALLALLILGHRPTFAADTIRLFLPEPTPAGWRIAWESRAGARDEVQRWDGVQLTAERTPAWEPVARVEAVGAISAIVEPSSAVGRRFYRIVRLVDGPVLDLQPPLLSALRVERLGVTTNAAVRLSITATDASGIREVAFLADSRLLGPGVVVAGPWTLTVPYAVLAGATGLVARVTDGAGNVAFARSGVPDPGNTRASQRLIALDAQGRPVPSVLVSPSLGSLAPVALFPRGSESERDSFHARLPSGAQLVQAGDREVLRFPVIELRFGSDTPVRFDVARITPGVGLHGQPGGNRTITAIDEGVRVASPDGLELPAGPLAAAEVEVLLGLPAGSGVPLSLFDRFSLRWHSGVLEDGGIRGGRFGFDDLPLPALSGHYPDHLLDLSSRDQVRLPYHGSFEWPTDGAEAPVFRLGPADPGWLTLRPDGSMGWNNRSELRFPGGGRLRVDARLDDPLYRFVVFADSVQVPLIGNLADLILPDDPAACLDPGLDPAALTRATGCLDALGRAYVNVAASAVAAAPVPDNPEASGQSLPPDDLDTSVSVLTAWAHRAVAAVGPVLPLAPQRELLEHTGRSAAGVTDLASAATHRAALARAAVALHRGTLSGTPEDLAALDLALQTATAAALLRARDPAGITSHAALFETVAALVETQSLLAEANRPQNNELHDAVRDRIRDFLEIRFDELDVVPGQFSPAPNSVIARMNRFVGFQQLHEILDVWAQAALLSGDPLPASLPFSESLSQIALRLWDLVRAALDESEAAGDVHGFQYAFEDLLDLQASRQLSIFPARPEVDVIPMPDTAAFGTLVARLGTLLVANLERPDGEGSVANELRRLRRLARILREIPASVTLAAPPFERAHERIDELLAEAVAQPGLLDSSAVLLALLELGILDEQLRRRMSLVAVADWDSVRLPALVARLAEVAVPARAWSELDRARRLLLDEARRVAVTGPESRRRRYLEQAVPVLTAARNVAVALWESERSRRDLSPLGVADLALPGDLFIDKIAGGAFGDRHSGRMSGAIRGRLGLPKFDGRLELVGASFNEYGAFRLAAHGSASFRGVTVGISSRQPLTAEFTPPGPLRLDGEAVLALPNGMSFFARLFYDDPAYGFRFEARDLRFELVRQLTLLRPVFDSAAASDAGDRLRVSLADYYASMNAALDGLARQAGNLPDLGTSDPAQPPDFQAPQLTLPFSELSAWSSSLLLAVEQGVNRSHAVTASNLRQVIQTIGDDAALAAETLETEQRFLDLQLRRLAVLRQGAQSIEAADERGLLGTPSEVAAITEVVHDATRQEARLHQQYLAARPPTSLADTARHVTALLDLEGVAEALGASYADLDEDGFPDASDSCPALWSSAPIPDTDGDELGDACDPAPADISIPGAGPCLDARRLVGQPQAQAAALLQCQLNAEFVALGLDPATGAVTNAAALDRRASEELEYLVHLLLELESQAEILSLNTIPIISARLALRDALVARWAAELQQTPDDNPLRQFELVLETADLLSLDAGAPPGTTRELLASKAPAVARLTDDQLERLGEIFDRRRSERDTRRTQRLDLDLGRNLDVDSERLEASRRRGFVGDSLVLLEVILGGLSPDNATARIRVDSFVRNRVQALRDGLVDPEFLLSRLGEAEAISTFLADAAAWAAATLPEGDPLVGNLRLTLDDFTVRLTAIAEARRAWWLLHRHARILHHALDTYGERMSGSLRDTFRQSFAKTLVASDQVLGALASLADAAEFEAFKVQLPGELRVRRAFGGVVFDRETEVWTGTFGGRLEFPDLQSAFFEISNASIGTDGAFQIAAATGGPLPFGRLGLTTSIQVAGSLAGLQSISGSGQLSVPLESITNLYSVAVGYDFPSRRLRFDTQAQNVDWRLSENLVLFNGGLGVEFSTAEPDGALTFRGSAGIHARTAPLPATLSRTNFHLVITNAAVRIAANPEAVQVAFTNGTLLLPEFFRTSLCATNRVFTNFVSTPQGSTSLLHSLALASPPGLPSHLGPAISLTPTNPIAVTIPVPPGVPTFSGELRFRDLGFRIPGFDSLELAVCQARLVFPLNQPPLLTNVHAALEFPLPNQTNILELADAAFSLEGLPTGTIRLRTNLDLYRDGDWRLSLLGSQSQLCPAGTGLTLKPDPAFGNRLTLRLDAGMEFALPAQVLSDAAGGPLTSAACGFLAIPIDLPPTLAIDGLGFSLAQLRLGGSQGLLVTNASFSFSGLTNLFEQSPTRPVLARLGGTLLVGGAGLGLSNAVFRFEGSGPPRFSVSELSAIQPGAIFGLAQSMPLNVDEARVRFISDTLPLPTLVAATNLAVALSGTVALPPGQTPILFSRVQDLGITFLPDGQPHFSVDGLGFGVDLTATFGESLPLNLGGMVYVGGLNSPPNYLFAGKLKGNLKGNAVEGLVALDACGIRGVCVGLAGAEVNIQLGYGFVLTGARGGVSFANVSNDPCAFADQLPIDPITGRPTGASLCSLPEPPECSPAFTLADLGASPRSVASTPDDLIRPAQVRHGPAPASSPQAGASSESFPCPVIGECPPASVNIFCMPHPEAGDPESRHAQRIIYKFTSIDEPILAALGLTPDAIQALLPQFRVNPRQVALDLAATLRAQIDALTPRAPADAPPAVRALNPQIEALLDEVELAFANSLHCAFEPLPRNSAQLAALVYGALRDAAFAGIQCQDLTLKLEGSVSYTGLASFANLTGGVVLSSTGSAGVIGSVNVFGIPVGHARAFVNQTDAQGNPILPSMCGELVAALGPLELGSLAYLNDCPDCTTELFNAFGQLPGLLSDAYVVATMERTDPALVAPGLSGPQLLARLDTPERQMAFIAAMMGLPPRGPNGAITDGFLDFVVDLANAVQPRWAMCGTVQPKLFGFPLSGGGKLYEYQFYAGPHEVDGRRDGYLLRDTYGFSPVQLMANYALAAFTAGLGSLFVPALDEAQASTSFLLPTFGAITREGFTLPPAEFAARRTRDFLANAVTTYSYRLAPFGMELGRAGGRILLPSLDHHPRGPSPRVPPELRGQGLPSELDVLLAALGDKDSTNAVNHLVDPTWRGEGNADFAAIFAGSPFAPAVAGRDLSLRDDYFPHGGFLGAGVLDLPALLVRPMPPSLGTALDASQPAATRLVALQDFVGNHLLRTERVGEMAFYVPAPNPPLDRFPTTPEELVASLRNFLPSDPLHLNTYYPTDEGFFQGWIDTPVLGLPTVRSRAAWEPQFARIRLDAEVPTNSWFNRYLGRARFAVELRGNTNQAATVAATFSTLSNQLARLTPTTPGLAATLADISRRLPGDLAQGLPKFSAALDVAQVRIPVPTYSPNAPITDAQTIVRIRSATLEAYSPAFQRPGATGDGALDRVRRDGGFAVRGDFDFLNGVVSIPGAELAVTPDPNPLGLPTVAGSFTGGPARFFGIPFGGPPAAGSSLHALAPGGAQIRFDAGPDRVRLEARGSIGSLNLGPLASLTPLAGTSLGASAVFETTTSELPRGSLSLQPCRFASPLLGTTVLRLHGATTNAPFTIDPAGPWNASVSISPNSGIDLHLAGERVLRLARAANAQPFRATLSAVGLASPELVVTNLHLGFTVETFPDERTGDPRRRSFTLGAGADASLRVAGDGTVDFRVAIPQALPLGGSTVTGLDAGFELRVSPAGLTFSGTAGGGLWASLGGTPLAVTVTATSSALAFSAQAGLPPLRFGVFRVEDDAGRGPRVTVSNSGVSLPAGLLLRVAAPALRSPILTLDRFVIGAGGAFQVVGQLGGAFEYDGLTFASPTHTFARNASGTVTYTIGGNVPPRDLPGFGSIQPRSGSTLRASAIVSTEGSVALTLDAALLRLTPVGATVDALLHGTAGTNAPFTYATSGPWSAAATFLSLIVDPPGAALPEFVRLSPASGSSLFTASVAGNQGSLTSLAATRTGSVHFELFRGSPMARAFTNINAGTISLALATSPRRLDLALNPPDLAYATNFVVGNKLVFIDLFRLASDTLHVTVASDAAFERSIQLGAPTLTLLPGSLLERSLTALPTQTLAPANFAVFTGTPFRTLGFPGLPVVRLPSGSTGLLTLSPAGFSSPIPFQEGIAYSGLITLPATSSQLSLDFTGSRLRLRFATGPSATVLGRALALDGGEATLEVATGGGFTGTFRTTAAPPRNLGNNLLGFFPSGQLTLDGIASEIAPNYRLAGRFALALAYPNPANPVQSLTHQRSVDFDLGTDGSFSATLASDLPAFDLGWLRVQRGNDGHVSIQRNGATGDFSLAFQDWDVRVLGFDYDNQDFAVNAAGTLTRALPAASFSLGSGTSRLRLASGGTLAFDWLASPDNANPGRTFLDLPATTSLSFTNVPGLSGTLLTGFPLGAAISDIPSSGTFDRSWNQTLVLNNLDFGTVSARLRRTTHGGPIQFSASRDNAFWSNLDLSISASTSGSDTFSAALAGTFSVGNWDFGSASFTYQGNDPTAPFQGSATITDPSGTVGFTTGIKLRGGARACLEFNFGGVTRTLCGP